MNRKTFFKLIGPLPKKVALCPKIIEKNDYSFYVREKIEYSTEINERVRAYLLIPKKRKRLPAVFCHHQHASNYNLGKSEIVGLSGDISQAYGKELAKRGYVVFASDAIAFEERNWHKNKESWWGVEYFELASRLIKGETLLGKVLHDISVGIDYLSTRPEVNAKKIGFLGHSYGGRMAIFAPVFDRRIKASVSNCYCISYKNCLNRKSDTRIPFELCIPNILQYGDVGDIVKLIEPSSLYLSVAADDKWSHDAKEIYNYSRGFFKRGQLQLKVWSGQHAFTKNMRRAAYLFLDQYLK